MDSLFCYLAKINWEAVASVVAILALGFAGYQTWLLRKTYKYNCDWQEKSRAVSLARMYKNEILGNVSYISKMLKRTGIMNLAGNINATNIHLFNRSELINLTNSNIEEQIKSKEEDLSMIGVFLSARAVLQQSSNARIHDINPNLIQKWVLCQQKEKDEKGKLIEMDSKEQRMLLDALWYEFECIVSDTLNSLEYFAMNFESGVADHTVVYQSLHQSYITLVQVLYIYIARQNILEKDKYYTNVIALYKKWVERDRENANAIEDAIIKPKCVRK